DKSPEWQGWMLPIQQDGHLLHVSYYAADVAAFAESFMLKTGMKKMGQRQLPGNVAGDKWQSVEARAALARTLHWSRVAVRQRFTKDYVETLGKCNANGQAEDRHFVGWRLRAVVERLAPGKWLGTTQPQLENKLAAFVAR
ncbi:unnamed protein product, partial [Symbiodinium necroappetens]